MPVFWIGFNIAMFPASVVVKHRGGLIVMGAAGLFGALAVLGAELAGSLNILIAAQFVAGAAWGCMLMSAVSAALAIGETGAEGKVVGLVFSALALATFARMAAVAGGLQKLPEYAPLLQWAPVACWAVAGAGLLVIAASRMQRSAARSNDFAGSIRVRLRPRNDGLRLRRMNERPRADFGIRRHLHRDHIGPAIGQRLFQRGAEMIRRGHAPPTGHAEALRQLHEIRVLQIARRRCGLRNARTGRGARCPTNGY